MKFCRYYLGISNNERLTMSYTMTADETAIWDGNDDAARDELRREVRMRFRSDSRGDVHVYTNDGVMLFVVENE